MRTITRLIAAAAAAVILVVALPGTAQARDYYDMIKPPAGTVAR